MNNTTLVDLCTVVALLNQDLLGKEAEANQLNARIQELTKQVEQLQAQLNEQTKKVK